MRTGRYAIMEQLVADGVTHMFGNPGTVEQGFLDSLSEFPQLEYILALQETIAVGVADGYARATRKPTIVQLHSGVGLGNGIGMIYQAKRGHAPLVVLVGESGLRYDAMEAQMWADLVGMAAPVTKWATRVVDPSSVLRVLRRAMKEAATPPGGPVLVSLPMDVLDAQNDEEAVPTSFPSTRSAPNREDVARAAAMLAGASRPMIIVGDGVVASGAQSELTALAEMWGAEVWGADLSEVTIPFGHPLFQGMLGHMFGDHSRSITAPADAVLICGTYVFPEVFPALSDVFSPGAPVIHVDLDAHEIAKNFPVDVGFVADPKQTLAALGEALGAVMSDAQRAGAAARIDSIGAAKEAASAAAKERDRSFHDSLPLHASLFAEELSRKLPGDAVIFDEALTTSPELTRYLVPNTPGQYFLTRGGSLGVGFPGAIGLKIANPDKTVFGFSGDGGSMYTIQCLWTAARYGVATKFVVCNNRSYELLKVNIDEYWKERGIAEHAFPVGFDLADPPLHFDRIAAALGIGSVRVEKPDQIGPAIDAALAHDGPFLIDLVIANQIQGVRSIAGSDRA
ncbi:MAG: thiamine pyrophosphate-binding protein [Acidimicrobiales bacterium]